MQGGWEEERLAMRAAARGSEEDGDATIDAKAMDDFDARSIACRAQVIRAPGRPSSKAEMPRQLIETDKRVSLHK